MYLEVWKDNYYTVVNITKSYFWVILFKKRWEDINTIGLEVSYWVDMWGNYSYDPAQNS